MANLVDSRDVLDPDAMTRDDFQAQILGHWRRVGANSWDPYKYRSQAGGVIEVLPRLKVQLERYGARVRMRREGKVVRVEWQPSPSDWERMPDGASPRERRKYFIANYLETFDEDLGRGLTSVLAGKIMDK